MHLIPYKRLYFSIGKIYLIIFKITPYKIENNFVKALRYQRH